MEGAAAGQPAGRQEDRQEASAGTWSQDGQSRESHIQSNLFTATLRRSTPLQSRVQV